MCGRGFSLNRLQGPSCIDLGRRFVVAALQGYFESGCLTRRPVSASGMLVAKEKVYAEHAPVIHVWARVWICVVARKLLKASAPTDSVMKVIAA